MYADTLWHSINKIKLNIIPQYTTNLFEFIEIVFLLTKKYMKIPKYKIEVDLGPSESVTLDN